MVHTILVAGGLGYIGSHVTVTFLKAGYHVVIADDCSNSSPEKMMVIRQVLTQEGLPSPKLDFIMIDLTSKENTLGMFHQYNFDAVIALAGFKAVGESTMMPVQYYQTNLGIINNLLAGMEATNCYHLIFSSSATVYDPNAPLPYRESSPIGNNLTSPYGESKYLIERVLASVAKHQKKFKITSLRYFNPVGNHPSGLLADDPKKPLNLFPVITKSLLTKIPFTIFGTNYNTPDGSCQRDFIHVEDVSHAHLIALEVQLCQDRIMGENQKKLNFENNNEENYQVYNIGTGKPLSVLEIIRTFETVNNIQLDYIFGNPRAGDSPVTYSDPSKIMALGWSPKWSLDDCVRHSYRGLEISQSSSLDKSETE